MCLAGNKYVGGKMQFEYLPKKYSTVRECIKSFYHEEGIRGLFKAQVATILRDIPQYAGNRFTTMKAFFTTFETCKYLMLKRRQGVDLNFWE
jgi:hypothetical protein